MGNDAVLSCDDILHKSGIHLVHRGQGIEIPPAVVAMGPVVEGIPAAVRRLFILIGALAGECAIFIEVKAVGTGVGVHAIENHLDTPGMGGIDHGLKLLHGAKQWVRGLIIAGVIAVAGKTLAYGIQVENGGAQRGNIVHFLGNAPEVTAVEIIVQHQALRCGLPENLLVPAVVDHEGFQLPLSIELACGMETVREQLIDGCALCPIGGLEIRRHAADLPKVACFHVGLIACFEEIKISGAAEYTEMIEVKAWLFQLEFALKDIISTLFHLIFHGDRGVVSAVFLQQDNIAACGLNVRRNMNVQGTNSLRGEGTKGGLVDQLLAVIEDSHGSLLGHKFKQGIAVGHYTLFYIKMEEGLHEKRLMKIIFCKAREFLQKSHYGQRHFTKKSPTLKRVGDEILG